MTARRYLWAPLAASLALAACGGGDAPSKEEFARDADTICSDLEKAGDRLSQQSPDSAKELVGFVDDAKKEIDEAVGRLEDLEVPDGDDGEKAQEFKDEVNKNADTIGSALDDMKAAAEKNDVQGIQAAAKKAEDVDEEKADQLARDIGADKCAE